MNRRRTSGAAAAVAAEEGSDFERTPAAGGGAADLRSQLLVAGRAQRLQFCVLPFGLASAPTRFHQLVGECLGGLRFGAHDMGVDQGHHFWRTAVQQKAAQFKVGVHTGELLRAEKGCGAKNAKWDLLF